MLVRRWNVYLLHGVLQACIVLSVVHRDNDDSNDRTRDNKTYEGGDNSPAPANAKQIRWANGAFNYIHKLNCNQTFYTTDRHCKNLIKLSKSDVNIYIADPSPYGRLRTVVPDDDLDHNDIHDAVLVLDPYPEANLGHLVVVFYIDLYLPKDWCEKDKGFILQGGECMTLALKRRCRNALERKSRSRRNFARKCEINFIPMVHLDNNNDYMPPQQKLTCRSNIPGFKKCPELIEMNGTIERLCGPLRDISKKCEPSNEHIHTSCRRFEICDQAVIVSGGWNKWSSRARYKENTWEFYHMLKLNGFIDRNIKVFYANGDPNGIAKENSQSAHEVYPAAYKTALRYHVQKVCSLPHCADSLVIYMNGISMLDGTTLLWDINQDGIADDDEMYKFEEFLGDIANCHANQVHVILDQSFSGEVARGARRSQNHRNVAVYASSKDHEYSWRSEFTKFWTRSNHTKKCMKENFKYARHHMEKSTPDLHQGELVRNKNLFGAPCDVTPPFTFAELKKNYLGCQNLPTSVWFRDYASADISFIGQVKSKVIAPKQNNDKSVEASGANNGKSGS